MLQIVRDFLLRVSKPDDQYEVVGPVIRDLKNAKVIDVGSPNRQQSLNTTIQMLLSLYRRRHWNQMPSRASFNVVIETRGIDFLFDHWFVC